MRRSVLVGFLVVLCLAATPVPADAWFWRWLDDLSGPQFQGFVIEGKFYCFGQTKAAREDMLKAVLQHLDAELIRYERLAETGNVREEYYNSVAVLLTERARGEVVTHLTVGANAKDANKLLRKVANLRLHARVASDGRIDPKVSPRSFESLRLWLNTVERRSAEYTSPADTKNSAPQRQERSLQSEANQIRTESPVESPKIRAAVELLANDQSLSAGVDRIFNPDADAAVAAAILPVLSGGRFSACKFDYLDVDEFFLSANLGYGWETKPENRGRGLKMVTLGVSAHWTIVPALTVGAGVGTGRFFTRSPLGNFSALYVDAPVIEIKPLTFMMGNPRFRSPWVHAVYLRYNGTIFPRGFDENAFFLNSKAYPKPEYINSLGVFLDIEPFLRNRRGKWWKDKP